MANWTDSQIQETASVAATTETQLGSQIGGSAGNVIKKAVPALMLLTVVSAITPPLGAAIANSVSTIPIVAPLASTSVSYGQQLRSRFGR